MRMRLLPTQRRSSSRNAKDKDKPASPPPNPITKLEKKLKQTISISTNPSDISKCNQQTQSPLFQLPGEIRNLIFEFTTQPYTFSSYGFYTCQSGPHPWQHVRVEDCKNLLLTCRRVWLEANSLLMHQVEHTFFLGQRAAWPNRLSFDPDRLEKFLSRLTQNNAQHFEELRLVCGKHFLWNHVPLYKDILLGAKGFCPRILTFKVCEMEAMNKDWNPHGIKQRLWLERLLNSDSLSRLEEIRLEIEIPSGAKANMMGMEVDEEKLLTRTLQSIETKVVDTERPSKPKRFHLQLPPTKTPLTLSSSSRSYCGKHGWTCDLTTPRNLLTFVWKAQPAEHERIYVGDWWMIAAQKEHVRARDGGRNGLSWSARRVQKRWEKEGSLLVLLPRRGNWVKEGEVLLKREMRYQEEKRSSNGLWVGG